MGSEVCKSKRSACQGCHGFRVSTLDSPAAVLHPRTTVMNPEPELLGNGISSKMHHPARGNGFLPCLREDLAQKLQRLGLTQSKRMSLSEKHVAAKYGPSHMHWHVVERDVQFCGPTSSHGWDLLAFPAYLVCPRTCREWSLLIMLSILENGR